MLKTATITDRILSSIAIMSLYATIANEISKPLLFHFSVLYQWYFMEFHHLPLSIFTSLSAHLLPKIQNLYLDFKAPFTLFTLFKGGA